MIFVYLYYFASVCNSALINVVLFLVLHEMFTVGIASLKLEGKALFYPITWQLDGSMLSAVRNTVILQCFHTVGWITGRIYDLENSESAATTIAKSLLLGIGA